MTGGIFIHIKENPMSNLKKFAVKQTAVLHFRDAAGELMYADGPDNKPDLTKPMRAVMYSPGSKEFSAAKAAEQNRSIDLLKAKGKSKRSPEEIARDRAATLAACTSAFENIEVVDDEGNALSGNALFKAVYADQEIGFIADQAAEMLGDWANFTKG